MTCVIAAVKQNALRMQGVLPCDFILRKWNPTVLQQLKIRNRMERGCRSCQGVWRKMKIWDDPVPKENRILWLLYQGRCFRRRDRSEMNEADEALSLTSTDAKSWATHQCARQQEWILHWLVSYRYWFRRGGVRCALWQILHLCVDLHWCPPPRLLGSGGTPVSSWLCSCHSNRVQFQFDVRCSHSKRLSWSCTCVRWMRHFTASSLWHSCKLLIVCSVKLVPKMD